MGMMKKSKVAAKPTQVCAGCTAIGTLIREAEVNAGFLARGRERECALQADNVKLLEAQGALRAEMDKLLSVAQSHGDVASRLKVEQLLRERAEAAGSILANRLKLAEAKLVDHERRSRSVLCALGEVIREYGTYHGDDDDDEA